MSAARDDGVDPLNASARRGAFSVRANSAKAQEDNPSPTSSSATTTVMPLTAKAHVDFCFEALEVQLASSVIPSSAFSLKVQMIVGDTKFNSPLHIRIPRQEVAPAAAAAETESGGGGAHAAAVVAAAVVGGVRKGSVTPSYVASRSTSEQIGPAAEAGDTTVMTPLDLSQRFPRAPFSAAPPSLIESKTVTLTGQVLSLLNFPLMLQETNIGASGSSSVGGVGDSGGEVAPSWSRWKTDERVKFTLVLFDDDENVLLRVAANVELWMSDLVNNNSSEGSFGDVNFTMITTQQQGAGGVTATAAQSSSAHLGGTTLTEPFSAMEPSPSDQLLATLRGKWKRMENSILHSALPLFPRHTALHTVGVKDTTSWVLICASGLRLAPAGGMSVSAFSPSAAQQQKQQHQRKELPSGGYRVELEMPASSGGGTGPWSEVSMPMDPAQRPAESKAVRLLSAFPNGVPIQPVRATVRLHLSSVADVGRHDGKQSVNGDRYMLETVVDLDVAKLFVALDEAEKQQQTLAAELKVRSAPVSAHFDQFGSVDVVVEVCGSFENAERQGNIDWVARAAAGLASVKESVLQSGALSEEQKRAANNTFLSWMERMKEVAGSTSSTSNNSNEVAMIGTAILDFTSAFAKSSSRGPSAMHMPDALAALAHKTVFAGAELDAAVQHACAVHNNLLPFGRLIAKAAAAKTTCGKWIAENVAKGLEKVASIVPHVGPLLWQLSALFELYEQDQMMVVAAATTTTTTAASTSSGTGAAPVAAAATATVVPPNALQKEIAEFQTSFKALLTTLAQFGERLLAQPPTGSRLRQLVVTAAEIAEKFLAYGWLMQRHATRDAQMGSSSDALRAQLNITQQHVFMYLSTYQLQDVKQPPQQPQVQVQPPVVVAQPPQQPQTTQQQQQQVTVATATDEPTPQPPSVGARPSAFPPAPMLAAAVLQQQADDEMQRIKEAFTDVVISPSPKQQFLADSVALLRVSEALQLELRYDLFLSTSETILMDYMSSTEQLFELCRESVIAQTVRASTVATSSLDPSPAADGGRIGSEAPLTSTRLDSFASITVTPANGAQVFPPPSTTQPSQILATQQQQQQQQQPVVGSALPLGDLDLLFHLAISVQREMVRLWPEGLNFIKVGASQFLDQLRLLRDRYVVLLWRSTLPPGQNERQHLSATDIATVQDDDPFDDSNVAVPLTVAGRRRNALRRLARRMNPRGVILTISSLQQQQPPPPGSSAPPTFTIVIPPSDVEELRAPLSELLRALVDENTAFVARGVSAPLANIIKQLLTRVFSQQLSGAKQVDDSMLTAVKTHYIRSRIDEGESQTAVLQSEYENDILHEMKLVQIGITNNARVLEMMSEFAVVLTFLRKRYKLEYDVSPLLNIARALQLLETDSDKKSKISLLLDIFESHQKNMLAAEKSSPPDLFSTASLDAINMSETVYRRLNNTTNEQRYKWLEEVSDAMHSVLSTARGRLALKHIFAFPGTYHLSLHYIMQSLCFFVLLVVITFLSVDLLNSRGFINRPANGAAGACFYDRLETCCQNNINDKVASVSNSRANINSIPFTQRYAARDVEPACCVNNCLELRDSFNNWRERWITFVASTGRGCTSTLVAIGGARPEEHVSFAKLHRIRHLPDNATGTYIDVDLLRQELARICPNTTMCRRFVVLTRHNYTKPWPNLDMLDAGGTSRYSAVVEQSWTLSDRDCVSILRTVAVLVTGQDEQEKSGAVLVAACLSVFLLFWWQVYCGQENDKKLVENVFKTRIGRDGCLSVQQQHLNLINPADELTGQKISEHFEHNVFLNRDQRGLYIRQQILTLLLLFSIVLLFGLLGAMLSHKKRGVYLVIGLAMICFFFFALQNGLRWLWRALAAAGILKHYAPLHKKNHMPEVRNVVEKLLARFTDDPELVNAAGSMRLFLLLACSIFWSATPFVAITTSTVFSDDQSSFEDVFHSFDEFSRLRGFYLLFQILLAPLGLEFVAFLPSLLGHAGAMPLKLRWLVLIYIAIFIWVPLQGQSTIPSSIDDFVRTLVNLLDVIGDGYLFDAGSKRVAAAAALLMAAIIFLIVTGESEDHIQSRPTVLLLCYIRSSKRLIESIYFKETSAGMVSADLSKIGVIEEQQEQAGQYGFVTAIVVQAHFLLRFLAERPFAVAASLFCCALATFVVLIISVPVN